MKNTHSSQVIANQAVKVNQQIKGLKPDLNSVPNAKIMPKDKFLLNSF